MSLNNSSLQDQIVAELTKSIAQFEPKAGRANIGTITKVTDGIATVSGLSQALMGEIVWFPLKTPGLVLNLKQDEVGIAVMGDYAHLKEGDEVQTSGKILSITASEALLGRIVNPLGQSIDGNGTIKHTPTAQEMLIEKIAPGVVQRSPVNTPLLTGITAIDSMTAIGRGQRELIIGDRNTGKTAIVIDTIINQAKENATNKQAKPVICIYVAIGQKQAKVAQIINKLEDHQALGQTIAVIASASDPAALQYLAPYAGVAIAEYFMERGQDVLIAYDDLSKHAWAYRQMSLILRRPSGREAYPGDIFYLHSRLLERSGKLNKELGEGSITALPIIETQAQDMSAYIPTNVISITDGQIYLESDLFYQGIRPAINVGLSVSRVGGAAQLKAMKQVAGKLRLDLAQYNELAAFAQFGSDLDPVSKAKIDRGQRLVEILKQPQYAPKTAGVEILQLWFATNGYLDDKPLENCSQLAEDFAQYVLSKDPQISKILSSKEGLDQKTIDSLKKLAGTFSI